MVGAGYTSRHTEKELIAGKSLNQFEAIASVKRIAYLPVDAKAEQCFRVLMAEKVFPLSDLAAKKARKTKRSEAVIGTAKPKKKSSKPLLLRVVLRPAFE